jgi:hypothetical protein
MYNMVATGDTGMACRSCRALKLLPLFVQLCGFGRLARGAAISGAIEKAHPHEKHFYLFFMAVDPAWQGSAAKGSFDHLVAAL